MVTRFTSATALENRKSIINLLGFLDQIKLELERVIADAQEGVRSQQDYAASRNLSILARSPELSNP